MTHPCSGGNNGQSPCRECPPDSVAAARLTGIACEPIDIRRVVRRMRGGSQAHMVEGSDGRFYVAKFTGNPQGNRTLINEFIAYHFLQRLQVSTPALHILRLSKETRDKARLCFKMGSGSTCVQPGLHLGSQCPVNPATTVIFDFLPRQLVPLVLNLCDFVKVLVVDKLLGQTDSRQCIFVRDRGHNGSRPGFRAYMIDHGLTFAGERWEFQDSLLHGLYFEKAVYSMIDMHTLRRETVDIIRECDESGLYDAVANIPSTWFGEGDYAALAKLFSRLLNRVARVESLLSYHLSGLIVKRDEAIKAEAADPVLSASPPDSCAPTLVLGPETF
jgi:hypothetical protein